MWEDLMQHRSFYQRGGTCWMMAVINALLGAPLVRDTIRSQLLSQLLTGKSGKPKSSKQASQQASKQAGSRTRQMVLFLMAVQHLDYPAFTKVESELHIPQMLFDAWQQYSGESGPMDGGWTARQLRFGFDTLTYALSLPASLHDSQHGRRPCVGDLPRDW